MDTNILYLESAKKQFLYYKILGEKAMGQLEQDDYFANSKVNSNSIATIVKHLSGNMLSRWTDFMTTDGEKEWRNRDTEFEDNLLTKMSVLMAWNKGWDCLFDALNSLQPQQLSDIIYIRNEGHSVIEAINRQLAHYSYHVGQIVFYAKQRKGENWVSLSIPKNKSSSYNAEKFTQEKSIKNFTNDELKNLNN
jgi:hypothetical protein